MKSGRRITFENMEKVLAEHRNLWNIATYELNGLRGGTKLYYSDSVGFFKD